MTLTFPLTAIVAAMATFAAAVEPLPFKMPPAVPDVQDCQVPDRVLPGGWIGSRLQANTNRRLAAIDTDRLLEGYRKRPGRQSWDGEHVGKWLHAATLAWVNAPDPALREKLDHTVRELTKCQLPDGYLGTYLPKDRWTEWDVWAHKYNLIGLLTYIRFTGNQDPLPVCRRMADLLCETFGDVPGKRDLILAGQHVGMAPTSVLEPMVLLYRMTGEPRYLEFCDYVLRAWEQPNGPHIISRLLESKRVDKVGNGKAYEMLSCLNGVLEYYRATGKDPRLLTACLNAWQDIVDHRLYLTGAASYGEHFHGDFDLPNTNHVGETCVTVTWLQFNAQLLRLAGEARFAEQLERGVLNQLFGAQRPDGTAWGYYVEMEGIKPYRDTLDGHCCLSSGPRGVAMIPTFAITTDTDGVVVNLYESGKAKLTLRDGTGIGLTSETIYPAEGKVVLTVTPATARRFALKLRLPIWCRQTCVTVAGAEWDPITGPDGYASIARRWTAGDKVEIDFHLEPRVVVGTHGNAGKAAVCYGPLVLAADDSLLAGTGPGVRSLALAGGDLTTLEVNRELAPAALRTWPGARVLQVSGRVGPRSAAHPEGRPIRIPLVPFADAGSTGAAYRVWLPLAVNANGNLLSGAKESRSRPGNLAGSICDDDLGNPVVSFDGKPAAQDWFAVATADPFSVRRVVFTHGKSFHDGGWFDTSTAKPQVEIRRSPNANWETLGDFGDYPATTTNGNAGLKDGQSFTLKHATPVTAVAIRVTGTPAGGDDPRQAFSSCAELQAFAE